MGILPLVRACSRGDSFGETAGASRSGEEFFRDDALNLLDVIAGAYLPDQVIGHLKRYHRHEKRYADEQIESGKGVQGRYKQAVLDYFKMPSASLKGKADWVENLVGKAQKGDGHGV
ncbi:hypothetical protein [Modicisalibacter luteus]|uniref:hypothetical protein n=1 Tax=Modicisalibacter luteus TaxID=453962 RepID=UPI00363E49F0